MANAIEVAKLVGIGAIAAMVGFQTFRTGATTSAGSTLAEAETSASEAEKSDLLKIIEHKLRSMFKFPDSVKVNLLTAKTKYAFKDAGISVRSQDDDVGIWRFCGVYSAPTPLGLYGANNIFYARATVNHIDKKLGGELWLEHDGKLMHLDSLRDGAMYTSREYSEFIKAGGDSCSGPGVPKGIFAGYEMGDEESKLFEEAAQSIASNQGHLAFLNKCLSGNAKISECNIYYRCVISPDKENECKHSHEICTQTELVSPCVEKIAAHEDERRGRHR